MTELNTGTSSSQVARKLRELNSEYRDTQVALNQAQASLTRAMKLSEQQYHQRRKQIISANGHALDEEF
jgi:hypothetical protein